MPGTLRQTKDSPSGHSVWLKPDGDRAYSTDREAIHLQIARTLGHESVDDAIGAGWVRAFSDVGGTFVYVGFDGDNLVARTRASDLVLAAFKDGARSVMVARGHGAGEQQTFERQDEAMRFIHHGCL